MVREDGGSIWEAPSVDDKRREEKDGRRGSGIMGGGKVMLSVEKGKIRGGGGRKRLRLRRWRS